MFRMVWFRDIFTFNLVSTIWFLQSSKVPTEPCVPYSNASPASLRLQQIALSSSDVICMKCAHLSERSSFLNSVGWSCLVQRSRLPRSSLLFSTEPPLQNQEFFLTIASPPPRQDFIGCFHLVILLLNWLVLEEYFILIVSNILMNHF